MITILSLVLGLSCVLTRAAVPVTRDMRTIGAAIKAGAMQANVPKLLFEHAGSPGVITEQWFTGKPEMNSHTRIQIYIDGETVASLDFNLFLAHNIGTDEATEAKTLPWGTNRIAHAADGGIYNTYRIPFRSSIRIMATTPTTGKFWYIVRGVENYPLVVGDLQLPSNARLRLFKNEQVTLKPLEFLTLMETNDTAGMVFQVMISAASATYHYLEACVRAEIDAQPTLWLSSGTEDFFLSAYYFNAGEFHMANSGLTNKAAPGNMTAYKMFENDPLLFGESLSLKWRCGEDAQCPNAFPANQSTPYQPSDPSPTHVTTYTWAYLYDFE